ncbi:TPA: type VI secretion system tube protein Hcp, partial [Salmonella enterica subsp. enterica serovar Typhimurium]
IDRASPNLFKYCASGKHIPQAILVMRKAGGNPLEYLKYTFTDLIVAVVSPSGSGGTITAGYDFKANKEI